MTVTTSTVARFIVGSHPFLLDQPVRVRLVDAISRSRVRISARSTSSRAIAYSSWAEYLIPESGMIDPMEDAALSGTYTGIDPYGLWWSMCSEPDVPFAPSLDPVSTCLRADIEGVTIARSTFNRLAVDPGVEVIPLQGQFAGTLFLPAQVPAPGLLVLGGSEGGIGWARFLSSLFASHGFTALALGYFGIPNTPSNLLDIPLEYCQAAVNWLSHHSAVGPDNVGIVGNSRGAELGLLLGSYTQTVGAVVAYAPSGLIWPGCGDDEASAAAWTIGGIGLPFASPEDYQAAALLQEMSTPLTNESFEAFVSNVTTASSSIPIEGIRGPIMLVSGDDDRVWPAAGLAEVAMLRLGKYGHPFRNRHLRYRSAGHAVGWPPGLPSSPPVARHPLDQHRVVLGGTKAGYANSYRDSWPQVLTFLRANVTGETSSHA
jgi:hypothetical protein